MQPKPTMESFPAALPSLLETWFTRWMASTAQRLTKASDQVRAAVSSAVMRLVRQMRDDGATLRAIGDTAGLSHTAIAKILRKQEGTSK